MPTSAVTSAGASFTPSPTIATRFPCALNFLDPRRLLIRQHFSEDFVDAEILGDGLGDRIRIAGHHNHFDSLIVKEFDRLTRLLANGIRNREDRDRVSCLRAG